MQIAISSVQGFTLTISDESTHDSIYPTGGLKKGLRMSRGDVDLAEEAVGFGLPVIKCGLQTYFPGSVDLVLVRSEPDVVISATYTLDLVEKLARQDGAGVSSPLLYAAKNSLAALHRRLPPVRGVLSNISSRVREKFHWETIYAKAAFSARIQVTYSFDDRIGTLGIAVDLSGLASDRVTEVILMNEQGAVAFDRYRDSSGKRLTGKDIEPWSEVFADEASFESDAHKCAFIVQPITGAKLYRGRELIGSRLAWSGFGYSIPPTAGKFNCLVRIENLA